MWTEIEESETHLEGVKIYSTRLFTPAGVFEISWGEGFYEGYILSYPQEIGMISERWSSLPQAKHQAKLKLEQFYNAIGNFLYQLEREKHEN